MLLQESLADAKVSARQQCMDEGAAYSEEIYSNNFHHNVIFFTMVSNHGRIIYRLRDIFA